MYSVSFHHCTGPDIRGEALRGPSCYGGAMQKSSNHVHFKDLVSYMGFDKKEKHTIATLTTLKWHQPLPLLLKIPEYINMQIEFSFHKFNCAQQCLYIGGFRLPQDWLSKQFVMSQIPPLNVWFQRAQRTFTFSLKWKQHQHHSAQWHINIQL